MSGGTSTTREVKQLSLFLGLTKFVLLHPIHCSEVCSELGGFLPHDYSGYSALSGYGYGDEWHWVGYGADETRYQDFLADRLSLECHISPQHPPPRCWACRPSRWREGVRAFPCSTPLSFGCQRRRAFPLPLPSARPRVYRPRPRTVSFADTDLGLGAALPRPRTSFRSSVFGGRGFNSLARSNPYLNWL